MTESTMKAPKKALRPVKWMRENLFSGWFNTVLTLGVAYLLVTSVGPSSTPTLLAVIRAPVRERVPAGCLSASV